mmetsp:Transcript_32060/g.96060  ORF Transcript_32060/g.96060 Transcript_32060/m.96060 type:complete len:155 (+) Transcript_32060:327-791(+)
MFSATIDERRSIATVHFPPSIFPDMNLLNSSTGSLPLSQNESGRNASTLYLFVLSIKRQEEKDVLSPVIVKENFSRPDNDVISRPCLALGDSGVDPCRGSMFFPTKGGELSTQSPTAVTDGSTLQGPGADCLNPVLGTGSDFGGKSPTFGNEVT